MRKIGFRVWTGSTMEYRVLAGTLGAFYAEGIDPKDSACISPMNTIYSKETPTMQWTGLLDKNGKEIYEGDVLAFGRMKWIPTNLGENTHEDSGGRMRKASPKLCVVKWEAEKSGPIVGFILTRNTNWYSDGFLTDAKCRKAVVVGNIYENPELIKN